MHRNRSRKLPKKERNRQQGPPSTQSENLQDRGPLTQFVETMAGLPLHMRKRPMREMVRHILVRYRLGRLHLDTRPTEVCVKRFLKIQVNLAPSGQCPIWTDWLVIRKSNIPGAGYGLYADNNFAPGTFIGLLAPAKEKLNANENYIRTTLLKNPHLYCYTPAEGIRKDLFFGIHFANDPSLPQNAAQEPNIAVDENLSVRTLRSVKKGTELFWDRTGRYKRSSLAMPKERLEPDRTPTTNDINSDT